MVRSSTRSRIFLVSLWTCLASPAWVACPGEPTDGDAGEGAGNRDQDGGNVIAPDSGVTFDSGVMHDSGVTLTDGGADCDAVEGITCQTGSS
jgi:hypothetical protein